MDFDRLNPVALITGAASPLGAACARDVARRAEGGLILADLDATALDAAADALDKAPERVSTLAFDVADPERWAQAAAFMRAQYGRLDWAVLNVCASVVETDLVQWGPPAGLEAAALSLRALMPLLRSNAQGGAIVVIAPAVSITTAKSGLPAFLAAAALEGARDTVRVNAIAIGASDAALVRKAPLFEDLLRDHGSVHAALDALAADTRPVARFGAGTELGRLVMMLLSDASPLTGATLVVDGGYAI